MSSSPEAKVQAHFVWYISGTVGYDSNVLSPLDILDFVNAIGKFTAYIKSLGGVEVETTTVDIQGMSCQKCVNNIQGMSMKRSLITSC